MGIGMGPIGVRNNPKIVQLETIDGTDYFEVQAQDGTPVGRIDSLGNLHLRGDFRKLV